jgi:fatty acid desaturase
MPSGAEDALDPSEGASLEPDYAELKRRVLAAGLLEKQPLYYVANTIARLALLGASLAVLLLVDDLWLQLLNATLLAIAFTQLGYLGHDAGHRQIFRTSRQNDRYGLVINGLIGLSRSWWIDTHNQHHVNPNDLELDPHTALPVFAFSEEQVREKVGRGRHLVGYQAFYFFPILLLQGIGAKAASVQYLLAQGVRRSAVELGVLGLHLSVYFALVFAALGLANGLAFVAVHQLVFGLYMGTVFAPNHKGMPSITDESDWDFLRRQVLTSRDVKGGIITDFVYGGLNYQIEHHLFPSMPRNKLGEAQVIVRQFCQESGIPYKESGVVESNKEVLQYLHEVSAPLRV